MSGKYQEDKENDSVNINEDEQFLVSKKKAVSLFIGGESDGFSYNSGDLQSSFKKFRDQKIKERQIMAMCRERNNNKDGTRTEEFKASLREKFIEGCKKYIGVPYALRFKAENDPIAPLYLDCCGLVRQVVMDLQEDFGFIIGKWNQAYQMDTLPIVLTEEQLKPGDLIFYEGIYNNSAGRSKPQKHNNVHVEVYLGGETGESTVGSRYHRGKVSIFPSYKFKSTTWDLVQVHFRSLETWLEGQCVSHCLDHPWNTESLAIAAAAGKRSIFCEDCSQDVNAEEDYLEEANNEEGGGDNNNDDNNNDDTNVLKNNDNIELPPSPPKIEGTNDPKILIPTESKLPLSTAASKKPKRVSNEVSKSLSSLSLTPTKTGTNPVGKRREPAANVTTDSIPKVYYVSQSNGWKLVKEALDKRGWQQLPFEYQFSSRFGLKWVERRSQIDYRSHIDGQLVCHIPNNDIICTKVGLLSALREKFCKRGIGKIQQVPWLPETYDLESPADVISLLQIGEQENEKDTIWIYKPSCNNRGRGIKVVTGLETLKEICKGKPSPDGNIELDIPPSKGIVQRYIEDPLLVMPMKLKFDIRCYLLVARNFPQTLAFYHPGYCRLALKPYDTSSLSDSCVHLTNASVQKKDPLYTENKDIQIQSVSAIADAMEQNGLPESANYIRNKIDHEIMLCMVDVLKSCNGKLLRKHGYFDLLGCDFMLSGTNQLYLLEVNTNPALSRDNAVLEELLPRVVDGCIDLVLNLQGPGRIEEGQVLSNPPGQYKLIYDEKNNFVYS